MTGWALPVKASFGTESFGLHTDYRDILKILICLDDPRYPPCLRWAIALALFYDRPVPPALEQEAAQYLGWFLRAGQPEGQPGPRLLCWQQDAQLIAADLNAVAGCEIRAMPYVHWWTFLSWFHAMGPGRLSTVVGIRSKLFRNKPLEDWEKQFYAQNRSLVELQRPMTEQEQAEKEKLLQLLEGGSYD